MYKRQDSACAALTWDETHAAIEAMKEAKVFITGFGMPFKKALDGAKIAKEEFGMLTLCNTSPLPSEPMGDLSYLDFIVLNDIEARVLCGLPEDSDKPVSYTHLDVYKRQDIKCRIKTW